MNTKLTFCAPYIDKYSGEEKNFVFEYKVPRNAFERIQRDLTQKLKAKYCVNGHTFTFSSREELYQGLEFVAHWITICK